MKYREVDESAHERFFAIVNSFLQGTSFELETASLNIGDQIELKWVSLQRMFFSPSENTLFIHGVDFDISIGSPHKIWVGEELGSIRSIAMKDDREYLQVLNFREPLLIEAARDRY